MRIAVIEADYQTPTLDPRHGSLPAMIGAWLAPAVPGVQITAVQVRGEAALPHPGAYDGWVITGSRASAYDADPWIGRLSDWIAAAAGQGRPMLGLCFGHQIMARALGGRVERQGWRVGAVRVSAPGLPGLAGAGVHVWHQDQVTGLPPGARVLAAYPGCPVAALGHAGPALGLQWHPEYPPDYMAEALAEEGPSSLPAPVWRAAAASLTGRHDGAAVARAAADWLGWR